MQIKIAQIIPIIIIFQSFLFAFVLFTDRGVKKISNKLLATFLMVLAMQFLLILSENLKVYSHNNLSMMCVFGFMYGPLLYFYTYSLIFKDFKFKVKYLIHFVIPAVFLTSFFFSYPLCTKIGSLLYLSLGIYVFFRH